MSTRSKQISWYSVGVPMGERPRSIPAFAAQGGTAHVNVAGNSGTVTLGTEISQLTPAHVLVAASSSVVVVGSAVSQVETAAVNVAGVYGSVRVGKVFAATDPAHVNVAANSGTVRVGLGISTRIGHVLVAGISAQIVLQEAFITPDEPAWVNVGAIPSSVTLPPVGGIEITPTEPAIVLVAGKQGAVADRTNNIVQHTPAWAVATAEYGAATLLVTQNKTAAVNVGGVSADVTLQGKIVTRTAPIGVAANDGVITVGNAIATRIATVQVAASNSAVNLGLKFGARTGYVNVAASSGAVIVGYELVQNMPGYVVVAGNFGDVSLEAAPVQSIVQDEAAVVHVGAGLGAVGLGGPATCRWFAPADCLDESTIARKIMYKQPAEQMWLAYNFSNRLLAGEEITSVLAIDDGGAGVIGSPGIIQSYIMPNDEVKYLVVNGADMTNVRIQHRVLTSEGRTLEGDGFLYIRGEL